MRKQNQWPRLDCTLFPFLSFKLSENWFCCFWIINHCNFHLHYKFTCFFSIGFFHPFIPRMHNSKVKSIWWKLPKPLKRDFLRYLSVSIHWNEGINWIYPFESEHKQRSFSSSFHFPSFFSLSILKNLKTQYKNLLNSTSLPLPLKSHPISFADIRILVHMP